MRKNAAYVFLLIAAGLLFVFFIFIEPNIKKLLSDQWLNLFWCAAWSAFGIASGLWNSRKNMDDVSRKFEHYITYFIFVWFLAILASWIPLLSNASLKSYVISAITAIVVGFSGDNLAGNILGLKGK